MENAQNQNNKKEDDRITTKDIIRMVVLLIVVIFVSIGIYRLIFDDTTEVPDKAQAEQEAIMKQERQARRDSFYNAASPEEKKIYDEQERRRLEYEAKKKEREQEALERKDDLVFNNAFDNSVTAVEMFLKKNLNDADSYESVQWYKVKYNKSTGLYSVRHKYRANNAYGAKILADQTFYLTPKGSVTSVKDN